MPAPTTTTRQAHFPTIPATYSRLPHDDELYVMKAFARHCAHCRHCSDPYLLHSTGASLCPKGHQRALDVTQYLLPKSNHAFSVIDLEGNKRIQVEIPRSCDAVRRLLKAIECGLRLRPAQAKKPRQKPASRFGYDDDGSEEDYHYGKPPTRVYRYRAPERDLGYALDGVVSDESDLDLDLDSVYGGRSGSHASSEGSSSSSRYYDTREREPVLRTVEPSTRSRQQQQQQQSRGTGERRFEAARRRSAQLPSTSAWGYYDAAGRETLPVRTKKGLSYR